MLATASSTERRQRRSNQALAFQARAFGMFSAHLYGSRVWKADNNLAEAESDGLAAEIERCETHGIRGCWK
jgi:hypothetical protein